MSDNSYQQAGAQYESIAAMVAALEVDYGRLNELDAIEEPDDDELAELEALREQANGNDNQDEALEQIQEDALDVSVRSGWSRPGQLEPEEFRILLCTGGPAVQIVGELNQWKEPCSATIQHQDWFEPWQDYEGGEVSEETLLKYCQQFWFGE